jgi:hypothetical protein
MKFILVIAFISVSAGTEAIPASSTTVIEFGRLETCNFALKDITTQINESNKFATRHKIIYSGCYQK